MKIKKYTVHEMQEAIQIIRQDLGPEAVIVSSHKIKGKGKLGWFKRMIEVTAVLDDAPVPPIVKSLPPPPPSEEIFIKEPTPSRQQEKSTQLVPYNNNHLVRSQATAHDNVAFDRAKVPETSFQPLLDHALLKMAEQDLGTKVNGMEPGDRNNHVHRQWMERLLAMDVQEGVARALLTNALQEIEKQISDDMIELALINKVTKLLQAAYQREEDARLMTFVGQPGVGKTTTLTKLATQLQLLQKKQVALITLYSYRYGVSDQLKVYGDAIQVPVEVVMTPAELYQAIEKHRDKDHILIDTVGRVSKNTSQILELKGFLEAIPGEPDVFLVLNASTKDRDMFRVIEDFKIAHFNKYIFTKTDETDTLGSILNVVSRTGLPVAYYTDGQSIPDDLVKVHPKQLANLLFRSADHDGAKR